MSKPTLLLSAPPHDSASSTNSAQVYHVYAFPASTSAPTPADNPNPNPLARHFLPAPPPPSSSLPAGPTPQQQQPLYTISVSDETPHDLAHLKRFFTEYTDSLGLDLSYQSLAEELASLPGKYARPRGRLLLARRWQGTRDSTVGEGEGEGEGRGSSGGGDGAEEPLGCIALRPLPLPLPHGSSPPEPKSTDPPPSSSSSSSSTTTTAELKRLYIPPSSTSSSSSSSTRGTGLGRALCVAALEEARRIGYDAVLLDTLADMTAARRLYEGLGFVRTGKYYDTPVEGTVFYRMDLRGKGA